jgi:hypothetical protein
MLISWSAALFLFVAVVGFDGLGLRARVFQVNARQSH